MMAIFVKLLFVFSDYIFYYFFLYFEMFSISQLFTTLFWLHILYFQKVVNPTEQLIQRENFVLSGRPDPIGWRVFIDFDVGKWFFLSLFI